MSNDFIPDNEVALHFSAADVVVQPYLNATQSGVTQIAYYYDKPMIVTNVGGLSELVPDGKVGLVVEPDSAAVAGAIRAFFTEDLAGKFISNMKEEKKRFTWGNLCRQLLNLGGTA
jgi:glycosyltransferase involved in cell wall biosynthesis